MKSAKPGAPKAAARTSLDWPVHAGLVDRVLSRLEEKVGEKRRRRRQAAIASTSALAILLLAFWLGPMLRDTDVIATLPAQRQSVTLRDGSRAELNAATRLRTDFRYGRRHLRLEQGEALFSVVSDAARPFIVETTHGSIRVTGTVFNVRLSADDRPEVTLLEGSVRFESEAATPIHLAAGQQLSMEGSAPQVRKLEPADQERVAAWREGRLVLDGLTLAGVAERLAQYHAVPVNVAPDVAALRPGGTVPLANLRSVLEALQDSMPIRVEERAGAFYLTSR